MARPKSWDLRRRWELRVLVALPAVWILFAAVEGYVAIEMMSDALGLGSVSSPALDRVRLIVIGSACILALWLGAGLALAVTRPMRQLFDKLQHRLLGDAAVSLAGGNEMRQLSNVFDQMLLSFEKFVSDTHIVDSIPLGVMVVDRSDVIRRANNEARRLFPSHPVLEGRGLADVCPRAMYARLAEAMESVRQSGTSIEVIAELLLDPEPQAVESTYRVDLHPTTAAREVAIVIRDLTHLTNIRSQMQRVDQLAALGAHTASLAHEIGGGLMGIQMLIEALDPGTPAGAKVHDRLRSEVERAARLLDEIRSFGQANARERVPCNLGRLAEDILWTLEPRFVTKNIRVEKQINLKMLPTLVDRDRIVQAIVNILTNAFEAAPPSGTITVAVDRIEGVASIKVHNTGSFIPPDEREKIFTLFYTKKRTGTGFGLPQARRTLLDHGGDIEVSSAPDSGTEFVLRVPDQPPAPEPSRPATQEIG